jgi:cytochrome c551/c552
VNKPGVLVSRDLRRGALPALIISLLALTACGGGGSTAEVRDVAAAGTQRERPQSRIDVERVSAVELMDWAARTYPQFFTGPAVDGIAAPYVYRHFQGSGNYVGLDGELVYVLGPPFGDVPLLVGRVGDFECNVRFEACTAPSIRTPPAAREALEGRAAGFAVEVDGGPSLAYQWFRNDVAVPGATAATLTLQAATAADQGSRFSVKVSNARGEQTSAAATLTVAPRVEVGALLALMARHGCSTCHTTGTVRLVGPGFAEVGDRYAPTADAISYIASRIRFGSSGQWGGSMPSQPGVNLTDARAIAAGIVGLSTPCLPVVTTNEAGACR